RPGALGFCPRPRLRAATTQRGSQVSSSSPSTMAHRDPWKTVYLAAVIGGGTIVLGWSLAHLFSAPIPLPFFVLIGLTVLSGCATLRLPTIPVSFSISDSFTI